MCDVSVGPYQTFGTEIAGKLLTTLRRGTKGILARCGRALAHTTVIATYRRDLGGPYFFTSRLLSMAPVAAADRIAAAEKKLGARLRVVLALLYDWDTCLCKVTLHDGFFVQLAPMWPDR
jgi:hypothetical protein